MYEKVSTKLDFTSREEKVLKFWKENEIFEKSIEEKKDLPTYTSNCKRQAAYRPCADTCDQGYDSALSDNEGS